MDFIKRNPKRSESVINMTTPTKQNVECQCGKNETEGVIRMNMTRSEFKEHLGHKLTVVLLGKDISLECVDCQEVLGNCE